MFEYFETYTRYIEFSDNEIKEMFSQYKDYCKKWDYDINDESNFCDFLVDEKLENNVYNLHFKESNVDSFWEYFKKINCNEFSKNS